MRVDGTKKLVDFWTIHADARKKLEAWLSEVENAEWTSPQDIKSKFPSASFPRKGKNTIVFNIKSYRLQVKIHFQLGIVVINRIGTHKQYEKWTFDS
jgi:mRNA interferase HigB